MATKICDDCMYFNATDMLCEYRRCATNETGSCEKWTAQEEPDIKLANSYAPSPWSEWEKNAEKKNLKEGIWEMPKR